MGSSPRVRGKPIGRTVARPAWRLIPACAGKTPLHALMGTAPGAHPRVCGENPDTRGNILRRKGSSPRVRGKRRLHRSTHSRLRLIPACAGKTLVKVPSTREWVAHPRVCGENGEQRLVSFCGAGSSPRVRGKRAGNG